MSKYHTTHETYDTVFERDKGKCVMCKSYIALQLHHIHGRSRTKTNDPDNCVMLCYVCHMRVHENMQKYTPYLERYIKRMNERKAKRNGQQTV